MSQWKKAKYLCACCCCRPKNHHRHDQINPVEIASLQKNYHSSVSCVFHPVYLLVLVFLHWRSKTVLRCCRKRKLADPIRNRTAFNLPLRLLQSNGYICFSGRTFLPGNNACHLRSMQTSPGNLPRKESSLSQIFWFVELQNISSATTNGIVIKAPPVDYSANSQSRIDTWTLQQGWDAIRQILLRLNSDKSTTSEYEFKTNPNNIGSHSYSSYSC